MSTPRFALCLLTLNAGAFMPRWIRAVAEQDLQPSRILVMDSMSTDQTVALARAAGYEVEPVQRHTFGHGRTRQAAVDLVPDCEFVVFMTQDSLLAAPDALRLLLAAFDDPAVDVAYGRQLPHLDAGVLASHARLHNYPATGEVRGLRGDEQPGLQVAFCSDSFAAYRRAELLAAGGFPLDATYAEDMLVTAHCLLRGRRVAYAAAATTHHSHDYTVWQDFRRYFDTGVFHSRNLWLLKRFGRVEGRGKAFLKSELRAVWQQAPWRLPEVVVRTFFRYSGYRVGLAERLWPLALKRRWSMARQF